MFCWPSYSCCMTRHKTLSPCFRQHSGIRFINLNSMNLRLKKGNYLLEWIVMCQQTRVQNRYMLFERRWGITFCWTFAIMFVIYVFGTAKIEFTLSSFVWHILQDCGVKLRLQCIFVLTFFPLESWAFLTVVNLKAVVKFCSLQCKWVYILLLLSFTENLLQGSIATDKDSRLSWKEEKPEKVRESVIRFAESEKEEDEYSSGDDDFDKVRTQCVNSYIP